MGISCCELWLVCVCGSAMSIKCGIGHGRLFRCYIAWNRRDCTHDMGYIRVQVNPPEPQKQLVRLKMETGTVAI